MSVWGRKYLPVTEELSIRAQLLEEGGPKLWAEFMEELRETHLGVKRRKKGPTVAERLRKAYEAVVAKRGQALARYFRRANRALTIVTAKLRVKRLWWNARRPESSDARFAGPSDKPQIRLSELLGALSHALDMVEGQPAGPLRALLLDRHAHRPRDRPRRRADLGALLHAAAQGPRLQQQRGAHLPAVPHRRPRLQARRQDRSTAACRRRCASCSRTPA